MASTPPNPGGRPPRGHRPEDIVPPSGTMDGRQPETRDQGVRYVPLPPGPIIVQLPGFDRLVTILRGHRLAQLTSANQQREFARYMHDLNDWLARDVQDRQADLRAVAAHIDQLRDDVRRLRMGMGPVPHSHFQSHRPPEAGNLRRGASAFVVPPFPLGPGAPVPHVASARPIIHR